MTETVVTHWVDNMAFEAVIDGQSLKMDSEPQYGGTGSGIRPKPIVLGALCGCTGMDVISILRKKQVMVSSFRVTATGEVTETYPKYYHKIHLVFEVTGPAFEGDESVLQKVQRAVQLSTENYCGVNAMLKGSVEITHEVRLVNS